ANAQANGKPLLITDDGRITTASNSVNSISPINSTNKVSVKAPTLYTLIPAATTAGTQSVTLTVSGRNLHTNAVILWNGTPQPTKFISGSQLTANISSAHISAAGTAAVSVSSNGIQSNVLTFTTVA